MHREYRYTITRCIVSRPLRLRRDQMALMSTHFSKVRRMPSMEVQGYASRVILCKIVEHVMT